MYTTLIQLVSCSLILKVLAIVELLYPVSLFAICIFVSVNIKHLQFVASVVPKANTLQLISPVHGKYFSLSLCDSMM